jgi:hypothetical protein
MLVVWWFRAQVERIDSNFPTAALSFLARRLDPALLGNLSRRLLNARVRASREFRLELLNASGGIDVFQFAGEKWVASGADIDLQLLLGAAGLERIAAATGDDSRDIGRVNAVFHG